MAKEQKVLVFENLTHHPSCKIRLTDKMRELIIGKIIQKTDTSSNNFKDL